MTERERKARAALYDAVEVLRLRIVGLGLAVDKARAATAELSVAMDNARINPSAFRNAKPTRKTR